MNFWEQQWEQEEEAKHLLSILAQDALSRSKNDLPTDRQVAGLMTFAIKLSRENIKHGGGPFAALVAKDDRIVGFGANSVTSLNDPTAHAEIVAIRQACGALKTFQLTDCDLYTSCEPCPMCLGAIYWARPRSVYFAASRHDAAQAEFDDAFIYDEILRPINSRRIPTKQIMQEEAAKVLQEWVTTSNKTKY